MQGRIWPPSGWAGRAVWETEFFFAPGIFPLVQRCRSQVSGWRAQGFSGLDPMAGEGCWVFSGVGFGLRS